MTAAPPYIHATAVVDDGAEIGTGSKIWHFCHVLRGSRIGAGCVLGQNVMVGPDVVIGNGVKVQNNVSIYAGVTIEDDVFCGPSCVFTNVLTPRARSEEHTSELQSLMRISYAVLCLKKNITQPR